MRPLLLDTHVLFWALYKPDQLGPQAARKLQDASQSLMISYLSLLEIRLKSLKNAIHFDDSMFEDIETLGAAIVNPDRKLLTTFQIFLPSNKDPFDNLLIATAIETRSVLLTADRKILSTSADGLYVLDARK